MKFFCAHSKLPPLINIFLSNHDKKSTYKYIPCFRFFFLPYYNSDTLSCQFSAGNSEAGGWEADFVLKSLSDLIMIVERRVLLMMQYNF